MMDDLELAEIEQHLAHEQKKSQRELKRAERELAEYLRAGVLLEVAAWLEAVPSSHPIEARDLRNEAMGRLHRFTNIIQRWQSLRLLANE